NQTKGRTGSLLQAPVLPFLFFGLVQRPVGLGSSACRAEPWKQAPARQAVAYQLFTRILSFREKCRPCRKVHRTGTLRVTDKLRKVGTPLLPITQIRKVPQSRS